MLDSASKTYRVTLTLPNPGNSLPAGLRCRANFGVDVPAQAARRAPNGKFDTNLPPVDRPAPAMGAAKAPR
jgi:hypothetical protein